MKKVLLFLATQKGYEVLKTMVNSYCENIAAVVSFDEIGVMKNWRYDIENISNEYGIPFYLWKDVKNNILQVVKDTEATSSICISWRYLIPISINEYLEDKLIIFHDSLLPKYRGFAPVVTAMLCGEKEIGATAIFADDTIDTGEIISQKSLFIDENDYIEDVIIKMTGVYIELLKYVMKNIIANSLKSVKQDEKNATYSIWRDEEDYWIDWNWSATKINTYVHALGYPYKGAKTRMDNQEIRILKCSIESDVDFCIRNPGKIWRLDKNNPVIVCGDGLLKLEKVVDENGNEIKFTKIRSRMG